VSSPLDLLVGDWTTSIVMPGASEPLTGGRMSYGWLSPGSFLIQRSSVDRPEFPNSISVLSESAMHYFDTRGVSRLYHLSFEDREWRLWRADADFWQRFIGNVGDDRIDARWEKSDDGSSWEHDFDLIFTRSA
jgi:hypothetical protein